MRALVPLVLLLLVTVPPHCCLTPQLVHMLLASVPSLLLCMMLLLLLVSWHLPLMSAGPIAESYSPSGMMLLKLSYVSGEVMRFTLSFFT
jgi:hypothetical protein